MELRSKVRSLLAKAEFQFMKMMAKLLSKAEPTKKLTEHNNAAVKRAAEKFLLEFGPKVPKTNEWLGRCQRLGAILMAEFGITPIPISKVSQSVIGKNNRGRHVSHKKPPEPFPKSVKINLSANLWRRNIHPNTRERYIICLFVTVHEVIHAFETTILNDPELRKKFPDDYEAISMDSHLRCRLNDKINEILKDSKQFREKNANRAAQYAVDILSPQIG